MLDPALISAGPGDVGRLQNALPICTLTWLPCSVSMELKSDESENVKAL